MQASLECLNRKNARNAARWQRLAASAKKRAAEQPRMGKAAGDKPAALFLM
jgi:plasmid stabilization system protein ParE